jgi:hypothetical protein
VLDLLAKTLEFPTVNVLLALEVSTRGK